MVMSLNLKETVENTSISKNIINSTKSYVLGYFKQFGEVECLELKIVRFKDNHYKLISELTIDGNVKKYEMILDKDIYSQEEYMTIVNIISKLTPPFKLV